MDDAKCDQVYDYHDVDGVNFICAGNYRERQNACYVSRPVTIPVELYPSFYLWRQSANVR